MVNAKRTHEFQPDYAIAPGETLSETLESLGMSQKELATRTGLTAQSINRIIAGHQPITSDTANKLELATGVPARMWNNLEAQYRERHARIEEHKQLEADLDWLKSVPPVKELIRRGAIPEEKDKPTLLRRVLAFYGVSSVRQYHQLWEQMPVAARRSTAFKTHIGPTSAWIRLGELAAQQINTAPHDKGRFRAALRGICGMTRAEPEVFVPRMTELCAAAGVALCLVPEFPKAPWHGASKWLTPRKAMILLGLRGKRDDQFWFSFFHEAAHILNDSKKDMFIDDDRDRDDPRERRADQFAADLLIPPRYRQQVQDLRSRDDVRRLSMEIDVAPGIVVGQYQHLTGKYDWFNDLKRKLEWAK